MVNVLLIASSESHNELCFFQLANPISVDTVGAVTSSAAPWKNIKNAAITTFKPWISQAASIQVIEVSIWGILLSCHKCRERSAKESVVPFVATFALESHTHSLYIWYCVWIYSLFDKHLTVFSLCLAPIKSQVQFQHVATHLQGLENINLSSQENMAASPHCLLLEAYIAIHLWMYF